MSGPTLPVRQDPVYRVVGVDEADINGFYRAQMEKATHVPWRGNWSVFSRANDNLPKVQGGDLLDFLRCLGKSIKLTEKDGPAVCPSVFSAGTTRNIDNVCTSSMIGLDYDEGSAEAIQEWLWHQLLPSHAAIIHSSFRDGMAKDGDPAQIFTKYRVFLPLSREVNPEEFDVLIAWVFEQIKPSFGKPGFDTSCKDPSRLFYSLRTNPKSIRQPWVSVRVGRCLNPDNLPDGKTVEILVKEKRDKEEQEKQERERKHQELQNMLRGTSEAHNEREHLEHYARTAMAHAADEVASTPEGGGKCGGRNNTLFHHASCIGEFVGAGVLSYNEAFQSMVAAGEACGLATKAVMKTVKSGLEKGEKRPRDMSGVVLEYRRRQEERIARQQAQKPRRKIGNDPWSESPDDGQEQDQGGGGQGGDPPEGASPFGADEVPEVRPRLELDGDLHERSQAIINWLHQQQSEEGAVPQIFMQGRKLVRLVFQGSPDIWSDNPTVEIEPMDAKGLRNHLMQRIEFFKWTTRTNQATGETFQVQSVTDVPLSVCDNILAYSHHIFPQLEEVIRNPVIDANGDVIEQDGYRSRLKAWVSLGGIEVKVPDNPTRKEMEAAKELILDDLFGDFPFADPASRVNALGMCLLPYVRHLIRGCTPLHMISAPIRGTGKSKLVSLVSLIATGEFPENMTEGRDDEEWRKRITAALISTPSMIVIDNINRKLDTGSLAAVLTSTLWVDRLMGHSKVAKVRNTAMWCATANNPNLSDEIERRCMYIHMDPGTDSPENRSGFKHDKIEQWALKNRDRLLTACLTMVRYWVCSGMEMSYDKKLASFENWSGLIGGILESIGEGEHFLKNRDLYRNRNDSEGAEWKSFCALWHKTYSNEPVLVRDLQQLASGHEILEAVLGTKNDRSQRIRLGRALQIREGRVFGDFKIKKAKDEHKVNAWVIEPLA